MNIARVKETFPEVIRVCIHHDVDIVLPDGLACECGLEQFKGNENNIDVAVSLGGDGTFLRMARRMIPMDVPVFGINFGHLGFLAEIEYADLNTAIGNLVAGKYSLDCRNVLQAGVFRDGTLIGHESSAVNEFVVSRGKHVTLCRMELLINGKVSGRYAADGIIISTATGSTAYSLSAGGPLVQPGLEIMVITPICAHALATRPLVIPDTERVEIRLLEPTKYLELSADGIPLGNIEQGDVIKITQSNRKLRFVRLTDRSYYETWQEKLIRDM